MDFLQLRYNWYFDNYISSGLCIFKCKNPPPTPNKELIHISKSGKKLKDDNDHCTFESKPDNIHIFRNQNLNDCTNQKYFKYGHSAIDDFDGELSEIAKCDLSQTPVWLYNLKNQAGELSWVKEWLEPETNPYYYKTNFLDLLNQIAQSEREIRRLNRTPINGNFLQSKEEVKAQREKKEHEEKVKKAKAKAGVELANYLSERNIDIKSDDNKIVHLYEYLKLNQDIVDETTLIEIFME